MNEKNSVSYLIIKNSGMDLDMLTQLMNTPGGEITALIYSILRKRTFGELGGDPFIGDALIRFNYTKIREKFRYKFKAEEIKNAYAEFKALGLIVEMDS